MNIFFSERGISLAGERYRNCLCTSEYRERNTTPSLSREYVAGKSLSEGGRRFSVETLTSAAPLQPVRPLDSTKRQEIQRNDILTVILAVVSLFLVVMLVAFSVAVVVVHCRLNRRRAGRFSHSFRACVLSDSVARTYSL